MGVVLASLGCMSVSSGDATFCLARRKGCLTVGRRLELRRRSATDFSTLCLTDAHMSPPQLLSPLASIYGCGGKAYAPSACNYS